MHDKIRKALVKQFSADLEADPFQQRQVFQVRGLREEINRLQLLEGVTPSGARSRLRSRDWVATSQLR